MSRLVFVFVVLVIACGTQQDPTPVPTRALASTPITEDAPTSEELSRFSVDTLLQACERYEEREYIGFPSIIGISPEVKNAIQIMFGVYSNADDKREYCRRLRATTG